MKMPSITGLIKRRFLLNFRIDGEILRKHLPKPFSPQFKQGFGIGGICLIRLENIRPRFSPLDCGLSSENAAHRFAVKWESGEGVYIPRRDTDSILNHLTGGRVFPGVHHLADFDVRESKGDFKMNVRSKDGSSKISFSGRVTDRFRSESCFCSLKDASDFFERGSLGYSKSGDKQCYEGLLLETKGWAVFPLEVESVYSSYFSDESIFPTGSVEFDHALYMHDVIHEWHSQEDLCCC